MMTLQKRSVAQENLKRKMKDFVMKEKIVLIGLILVKIDEMEEMTEMLNMEEITRVSLIVKEG